MILDWDYVSQLPYVWYCVGVKSSFQHARKNASTVGTICVRWLMFSLSGPCELLFYFVLFPLRAEVL